MWCLCTAHFLKSQTLQSKQKILKYKHECIQLHLDWQGDHQIIGTDAFLHPSSSGLRACTSSISALNGRWEDMVGGSSWSSSFSFSLSQNIKNHILHQHHVMFEEHGIWDCNVSPIPMPEALEMPGPIGSPQINTSNLRRDHRSRSDSISIL